MAAHEPMVFNLCVQTVCIAVHTKTVWTLKSTTCHVQYWSQTKRPRCACGVVVCTLLAMQTGPHAQQYIQLSIQRSEWGIWQQEKSITATCRETLSLRGKGWEQWLLYRQWKTWQLTFSSNRTSFQDTEELGDRHDHQSETGHTYQPDESEPQMTWTLASTSQSAPLWWHHLHHALWAMLWPFPSCPWWSDRCQLRQEHAKCTGEVWDTWKQISPYQKMENLKGQKSTAKDGFLYW